MGRTPSCLARKKVRVNHVIDTIKQLNLKGDLKGQIKYL